MRGCWMQTGGDHVGVGSGDPCAADGTRFSAEGGKPFHPPSRDTFGRSEAAARARGRAVWGSRRGRARGRAQIMAAGPSGCAKALH